MNFKQVTNITIPEGSVVKITDPNGLILWQKRSAFDGLCFTALEDGSYGMSHSGTNQTTTIPKLQYSRDGINWTDWLFESINVNAGDKVYFKGDNPDGIGRKVGCHSSFSATGKFNISGNIMSILGENVTSMMYYGLSLLFRQCQTLISASGLILPATTLANYCYEGMFRGCTSLTSVPELPATTLANYCYYLMFSDCSSLTTAPALPAAELAYACYWGMFNNCSSLTTAPTLPATTLTDYCYKSMFQGCTGLTTAPKLPATELANYCYYEMFFNCPSLTTAPDLPATVMSYQCYRAMFGYCTSLKSVKHSIVNWDVENAVGWLAHVAATGVMRCPTNSTIPSNNTAGIPSGWSRINF